MPDAQPRIDSFAKRLWLASERDQLPAGAMRRCVGAAGEPSENVVSRYGSAQLYARPNVISLTKYNSLRYQYDGSALYKDGSSIDTGYTGSRLNFVKAPPALGVPDYLFLSGGGKRKKIDTSGNLTNWGIAAPLDGMVGALGAQDIVVIDDMETTPAASWANGNCNVGNEATIVYDGSGSLRIGATSAPWTITKTYGTPLNLATYANGDISLQTDLISFWVYMRKPSNVAWLWVLFDVDDGTFKKNYYRLVIQVVSQTANVHAANANLILAVDADRWTQIVAAKSVFERVGTALEKDWSRVGKVRIEGGNVALDNPAANLYIDLFQMYGGFPLGAGPAALQNGSAYKYYVTFGNDTTGNDSNPNDTALTVNNVIIQPVNLSQIPVSTDTQVSNRKLWRTTAGGAIPFLLDTIRDNTTTTYVDKVNDLPGQPFVVTPWQKNAVITANQITNGYYIDGGNGFYFKEITAGPVTTGAVFPTWKVPNAQWSALSAFDATGEIILPRTSPSLHSWKVQTAGTTGKTEPDWTQPSPITDGTVIWIDNGALDTTDNTATWRCQGINAQPSLDVTQMRLDNTVFPATAEDAAFFQGSMFVGRDSVAGQMGWVYVSPPGRSEGYGLIINVGTDDDPVSKVIAWDERLWVLTEQNIYEMRGTYPVIAPILVQGAVGLPRANAFTAKATPYGIVRQTAEDIRIFDNARDVALAFEALAPIERGQTVENVAPFVAVIAEHTKDEMMFSDGSATFALSFVGLMWRMVGLGLNALYYEDDTGVIQAATAAKVLSLEAAGQFTDAGAPVAVEWQTPSVLINAGALTFVKRVFFKVNCNSQTLVPTIIVDLAEYTLPTITNVAAGVIELPFQVSGLRIGFRLTGSVSGRVEWSGCDWDVHDGDVTSVRQFGQLLKGLTA